MSALAVVLALTFVWIGLIVGLSFIEAPVKFQAPGVTLALGLGIGRLVFRVLHAVQIAIVVVVVVCLVLGAGAGIPAPAVAGLVLAILMLIGQLAVVQPRLTRRSNAVLAGEDAPRSRAHHAYVALELLKLVGLLVGGIALLAHLVALAG
ncbi:hypothetical protein [Brachybacterium sp. ACRRE]|jgi:hypothetical protein|uniref:hypothetical protein n=1 Tax=Brachybacterium sp. ACRRE TaxID=2918184 RepID=UPI001EF2B566|nr:hypothetical protein [Brachybacterium sp. ACRRE]MCG7309772.1 hypothetical protein [Brachybacterium sp. ACRRE]